MDEVNGQYAFDMWVHNHGNATTTPTNNEPVHTRIKLAADYSEDDESDKGDDRATSKSVSQRQA